MRIRIVSGGSPRNTHLEVSDDSAPIPVWKRLPGVLAIDWHLDIRESRAVAKVTVQGIEVEVEADGEIESPPKRLFERTDGKGES